MRSWGQSQGWSKVIFFKAKKRIFCFVESRLNILVLQCLNALCSQGGSGNCPSVCFLLQAQRVLGGPRDWRVRSGSATHLLSLVGREGAGGV